MQEKSDKFAKEKGHHRSDALMFCRYNRYKNRYKLAAGIACIACAAATAVVACCYIAAVIVVAAATEQE